MPVPAAVQTRVNTFLANVAATAATRQATYIAARGRYWQGRRVCSQTPADGATAAPVLTDRPTDQAESWADLNLTLPANIEVNLWCDAYQAPGARHGYMLGVEVVYGGELWYRTQNFQGPETWRTVGWTRILA